MSDNEGEQSLKSYVSEKFSEVSLSYSFCVLLRVYVCIIYVYVLQSNSRCCSKILVQLYESYHIL